LHANHKRARRYAPRAFDGDVTSSAQPCRAFDPAGTAIQK